MIVLDTNVISELMRGNPNESVVSWVRSVRDDFAITSITLAEINAGLALMPQGKRQRYLATTFATVVEPYLGTRAILPFGEAEAAIYAQVVKARSRAGRPISTADAQIAAICLANDDVCATRNVKDFQGTGVKLVNPWEM
ncbi:putative nucleic acid-binding protein [Arcanobacterium wilhelmae]|uniref:Ribonuclease VapC n=1 Tax=Arcanobacterium wilhelmae TaxID=1803177 RepID=A0ABT9NC21_9ACTO|nr:type II toxin-antitoxin system VapC family toxin [Arcanobacterium wilhelmae]MDP9801266.1 putative nucleic acid-binding protein [Arcanobacterium wilhelmae]WFN90611.1 type II toxin-antitoxin system VapC family toxin [Arcanobacterium wilhelmae]